MTRYELLDRIGVGGMAEIFRGKAVAAGGFEKPVAIKRILPHLSQDKRFVELLIAEAKVLSLLKHRNIVQIFDVGLGDDNKYFLVMEYVDGKDLGAIQKALEQRRRGMPFDLALHVGAEICEALEHAHTARAPDGKPMNLVHRDVSPSNVLLSLSGEVKLTDFGIAKRAESEPTQAGAVRGKFAYISPEQARNEAITPRSDVFSVGILLWELVTNRRLFSGLGDLEALRAVRENKVTRPTEIDQRLTPDIDALIMSALSPDANKRPTAGQLGAKLRSLRYSLEVTVGDPATELAKIIDTADEVQRESQQMVAQHVVSGGFDQIEHTEATVIRIRTADAFSIPDKQVGMAKARAVIDRFEEEETKLAQLSGDQMRMLRSRRDSAELAPPPRAPNLPGVARSRRPTDEPTTAHTPLSPSDIAKSAVPAAAEGFDFDESTKLRVPDRRTPQPLPARTRPPTPMPGTVHSRSGPSSVNRPPPSAQPVPMPQQGFPPPMNMQPPMPQPAAVQSPYQQPQGFPPPQWPAGNQPPMQQPPMQQPMQQPPMQQPMQQPAMQQQPPGNYPVWGGPPQLGIPHRGASPTTPDMFDRPVVPRSQAPQVAGFGQKKPQLLQPWMLIVGALVMAGLAFAITRLLLS
ncbi:MAG: protein kinase [Myxococcota bacterium]|nr:protein kinase [Myxococcota bacterium]